MAQAAETNNWTPYKAVLRSLSPLIMDRFGEDDILQKLYYQIKGEKPAEPMPHEKLAEMKISRDPVTGQIAIPGDNLWEALIEGGRLVKWDAKRGVTNGKQSLLPSFLGVAEEWIPLTGPLTWIPSIKRAFLATGQACPAIRPMFPVWGMEPYLRINKGRFALEQTKKLITEAGLTAGLGSHRPQCRGRKGMFELVELIEVTEDEIRNVLNARVPKAA